MSDDRASVRTSRLLAFRAENVRSFRDGLELPMLAMGLADEGVPRPVTWHRGRPSRPGAPRRWHFRGERLGEEQRAPRHERHAPARAVLL